MGNKGFEMTYFDEELFPVTRITAGVVGEPGRRIFLLQAMVEGEAITWVVEKKGKWPRWAR